MANILQNITHQFDDPAQRHDAATLGMWVFLTTEIMFFGGLFVSYAAYRSWYDTAFVAASQQLSIPLGALNTAVLLTSSLSMALAVHSAQTAKRWPALIALVLTMLLGAAFLGIKGFEYYEKYHAQLVPGASFQFSGANPERAEMFFYLYFAMTGLHALHMIGGLVVVLVVATLLARGQFLGANANTVEMTGLYWHFVDVIWIFLFPLLYLVGHHSP